MDSYQLQISHIQNKLSDISSDMSDISTQANFEFSRPAFLKDKNAEYKLAKDAAFLSKQACECEADLQGAFDVVDNVDYNAHPNINYQIEHMTASVIRKEGMIMGEVYCLNDSSFDWTGNILELQVAVSKGSFTNSSIIRKQAEHSNDISFQYSIDISDFYENVEDMQKIQIDFAIVYYPYRDVRFILAGGEKTYAFFIGDTTKAEQEYIYEINEDDNAVITGYTGTDSKIIIPNIVKGSE